MKRFPFCTWSVRQILAGLKLMTRRIAVPGKPCKYKVGDVCYIGEALRPSDTWRVVYAADGCPVMPDGDSRIWPWKVKYLPSIVMPEWAARPMRLRVTAVREEPLWDITPEDCKAEGISGKTLDEYQNGDGLVYGEPRQAFAMLWDSLNRKPGRRWEDNPPVHVITFEEEKP